jgi:outer membrane protein assembly factor BamB
MTDTPEQEATRDYSRATRRRVLQATAGALAVGAVSGRGAAQASGPTVYVGPWDDNLYAVDAATGSEEWAFETGDWVQSPPTVVDDPESGDSIDSRVMLGTLGHHGNWRYTGQNIDIGQSGSDESSGGNESNESSGDGSGPGFSVGGALAGVGGAGYLLKRRLAPNDAKENT